MTLEDFYKYAEESITLESWQIEHGLSCIGRREPLPHEIVDKIRDCLNDFAENVYGHEEDLTEIEDTYDEEEIFYRLCDKAEKDTRYSLEGVNGNAYVIMQYVCNAMKAEGQGRKLDEYMKDAISADYSHLLRVSLDKLDELNAKRNNKK